MTLQPGRDSRPEPMTLAFPEGGSLLKLAHRELHLAAHGTPEQKKALGLATLLPRPWDPATCRHPDLRQQLWEWLEDVVTWLNHEYAWHVEDLIPACWPHHPHLVHDIAVLADQRRRAGLAFTSDNLEEWHRYALPAFTERVRHHLRNGCDEGHQVWPARSRHLRHHDQDSSADREQTYADDVVTTAHGRPVAPPRHAGLRLASVNLDTGEVID